MNDLTPSDVFKENGFVGIHGVLTKEEINIITNYCLIQEKTITSEVPDYLINRTYYNDPQSPGAFSTYGDPLMESLLIHIQPIIEQCTGLELYPTYSYYRVYRNGHDLFKHKDRESCEISVSLALGYSYDTEKYQWPLYVGENEIIMEPGDMVIYSGTEMFHWRDSFNIDEPAYHIQVFLHYVDANGPYKEYKYDNREFIGARSRKENLSNLSL